MFVKLTNQWRN